MQIILQSRGKVKNKGKELHMEVQKMKCTKVQVRKGNIRNIEGEDKKGGEMNVK